MARLWAALDMEAFVTQHAHKCQHCYAKWVFVCMPSLKPGHRMSRTKPSAGHAKKLDTEEPELLTAGFGTLCLI